MPELHDHHARLSSLLPMVLRSFRTPCEGIEVAISGVYKAFAIDAFNPAHNARLIALRDLVRQYLFESRSEQQLSLLAQYWLGARHARSIAENEIPRVDLKVDFGVRYYPFADGGKMKQTSIAGVPFKDRILIKVSNSKERNDLNLESFSQYLQERGLAVAHGNNSVRYQALQDRSRLEMMLANMPVSLVWNVSCLAEIVVTGKDMCELQSREVHGEVVQNSHIAGTVLEDLSKSCGINVHRAAFLTLLIVKENPKFHARSISLADSSQQVDNLLIKMPFKLPASQSIRI